MTKKMMLIFVLGLMMRIHRMGNELIRGVALERQGCQEIIHPLRISIDVIVFDKKMLEKRATSE